MAMRPNPGGGPADAFSTNESALLRSAAPLSSKHGLSVRRAKTRTKQLYRCIAAKLMD
jgi:hypothetical protein